ncbi:MAG: phosphotransferase [Zavarzinia sp.]|nr:phosphotransferase [Zavarzinia sp.]
MTARNEAIDAFLSSTGWGDARRRDLAGDASFRRYERVEKPDGRTAVLMDAPPPQENVRPFIGIARHLARLGLSAPNILAAEIGQGFLLLDDLGDDSYNAVLSRQPELETVLYEAAVDVLVELRRAPAPGPQRFVDGSQYRTKPYDQKTFSFGPSLVLDWHAKALRLDLDEDARAAFASIWADLWQRLPRERDTLMLRDYHADNLLWLPGRKGAARVGLLDFQDATLGPPAYDLVSLLEDARRDVDPALAAALKARYAAGAARVDPRFDATAFEAAYAITAAQRNSRIAGVFVRLWKRDGKKRYLDYLPRVWRHIERDLRHPLLANLRAWYDHYLPGEDLRAGIRKLAA